MSYTITVYNQGAVDAYNVDIVDYIPAGMSLVDAGWTQSGSSAMTTLAGPIMAGSSASVSITLQVDSDFAGGDLVNVAEIADAEDADGNHPEDVDSTPDSNPDNDAGGDPDSPADDSTGGDGTGNPGDDNPATDEDDSDPAVVGVPLFDLAMTKTLASGQSGTVTTGSDVTFIITVINQGNVDAYNVDIVDYIPSGLILNDSDWQVSGGNAILTYAGPLAAGNSVAIPITFTVTATDGSIVNVAEISDAEDVDGNHPDDADSDPDNNPDNDGGGNPDGGSDDSVDGDGSGDPGDDNPATDEDDSDPEVIEVVDEDVFDLALMKTVAAGQSTVVSAGDLVDFTITVYNQGGMDAYNVVITDYIPSGMSLADSDWTQSGSNATMTIAGPISAGSSTSVNIRLQVNSDYSGGDLVNVAEISDAEDADGNHPEDTDSNPDSDPGNDAGGNPDGGSDDTVDGDGSGTPGSDDPAVDEDDSDPAVVGGPEFDLALTKSLAAGESGTVTAGSDVTFEITLINQGSVDAYNIDVIDYIPSGLMLNDSNWSIVNGNAVTSFAGPLAAGSSVTIPITFTVTATDGSITNVAEITDAEDEDGNHPEDSDSEADNNPNNDAGGDPDSPSDGSTDGDGSGDPGDDDASTDEDDSDPEVIDVVGAGEFDLALMKNLHGGQPAEVGPGDQVTYTITVFNQGAIDAYNIVVTDYIPEGMSLADADWTDGGSTASITLAGPIVSGSQTTVDITLMIDEDFAGGQLSNVAEISDAEDEDGNHPEDSDSTPDTDPDNDGGGNPDGGSDDSVDGDGSGDPGDDDPSTDEDDSDPSTIDVPVFDLALSKEVASGQGSSWIIGDEITYMITVYNQGSVDAYNVVIADHLPSGLMLNDSDWQLSGSMATTTIAGPVAAGSSVSVPVTCTIISGDDLTNIAEIVDAEDADGNHPDDKDSEPDGNPANDAGGNPGGSSDDSVDGDGSGTPGSDDASGDEDDHDPETIVLDEAVFDLAMTKSLAGGQPSVVSQGDAVTYTITVFNQGDIDAYNVEITDYVPPGMMLADPNWMMSGSNAVTTLAGPIPAGTSITVNISLVVVSASGEVVNIAEISGAEDPLGNPANDEDSTPDSNPDNDAGGNPDGGSDDEIGGDGTGNPGDDDPSTDEDDSDPEVVTVSDDAVYDLALIKELAEGQSALVVPGDLVTYTIWVFNQGSEPVYNVGVVDYLPAAFSLADGNWSMDGSNAVTTIPGPIVAGGAASVNITLSLNSAASEGDVTNIAEITGGEDELGNPVPDSDSTPDSDSDNDGDPKDDEVSGSDGDEDDHDPETVEVVKEVADLSMDKSVNNASPSAGEQIVYTLSVSNAGPSVATGVAVEDVLPAGIQYLTSDSPSYDSQSGRWAVGTVQVGQTVSLNITALVTAVQGTIVNHAEITAVDQVDPDSTPDNADPNPDPNAPSDEDDEDIAVISVDDTGSQSVDLSLDKVVSDSSPSPGDLVIYTITVTNEGGTDATGVEVTDQLPSGVEYAGASQGSYNPSTGVWVIGDLDAGASVTLDILTEVTATSGTIVNFAEVTKQDQPDSDSAPDNGNPDDPNNPSGEDDEDTAVISLSDCPDFAVTYEVLCDTEGEYYTVIVSVSQAATISGDYSGQVDNGFALGPIPSGGSFAFTATSADGCTTVVDETPAECVKLAVELISFDGEVQSAGNLLTWITASETNSDYFTLYRSVDGINFEAVHTVAAQGGENSEMRYEFLDAYTASGTVYYSLSETDQDGQSESVGLVSLSRSSESLQLLSLSPVPAESWVDLVFSHDSNELVEVEMFDAAGSLIFQTELEAISGTNTMRIATSNYSPGVYILSLSTSSLNITEKLIKQ